MDIMGKEEVCGGTGTYNFTQVRPDLCYDEKKIELNIGESHQINKDDIRYVMHGKYSELLEVRKHQI